MNKKKENRRIVFVNHAVNYLTIDMCNAFDERFENVALITGSVHEQGTPLNESIEISYITKYVRTPTRKKFWSYIKATMQIYWLLLFKYRKYEVFCISLPPTAYLLNILLPHRFSMLIWDVYPDILKITGMSEKHLLYRSWSFLNRRSFKKSYKLFTIGEKISELIHHYSGDKKALIIPLWSVFDDSRKIPKAENKFIQMHGLEDKFIVQYSGNIGLTHNVEVVVKLAEIMQEYDHILFQIIGHGERVPFLKKLVDEKQLANCQFLPFQSDDMFPYSLSAADVGVVILDKLTSKGSVPSKSYNLMRYGIPSLYIAEKESELYQYARKFRHGECFTEAEMQKASQFLLEISQDAELQQEYSQNALKASENFKSDNAHKLVKMYLDENG